MSSHSDRIELEKRPSVWTVVVNFARYLGSLIAAWLGLLG
jgi:hypothetical protein